MLISSESGPVMAALVSPAPHLLAAEIGTEPLALIVIGSLDRTRPPPVSMLCDLFGLSRAEAEVASALYGGASAEEVAQGRSVSLVTVRTQIRSILGKSGAANLRDLERIMATLSASIIQTHESL